MPKGAKPSKSNIIYITTIASKPFDTSLTIDTKNIQLSEFINERKVNGWNYCIFDLTACQYNMILGRDFMEHIGIDNFFSTDTIQWIN